MGDYSKNKIYETKEELEEIVKKHEDYEAKTVQDLVKNAELVF